MGWSCAVFCPYFAEGKQTKDTTNNLHHLDWKSQQLGYIKILKNKIFKLIT